MNAWVLLREAWATVRAHRAHSLITGAGVALVMAATVVLIGQSHFQNQAVVESFNRPELRTVVLTDTSRAGSLDWQQPDRLRSLSALSTAWASSEAFDVANPAFADGGRVSARMIGPAWDRLPITVVSGRLPRNDREAILDSASAATLGLDATGGAVESAGLRSWAVVGVYRADYNGAPTSVLVGPTTDGAVRSISVLVSDSAQLPTAVPDVVAIVGDGNLRVDVAATIGDLGRQVSQGVSDRTAETIVAALSVSLLVVSMLSMLMIRSRFPEFGRRRALGCSRAGVMGLVMVQGMAVVAPAAVGGALVGVLIDAVVFGFLMPPEVPLWVLTSMLLGACVAQLPSAAVAALRDPVLVLRTP
ncbi:MAG: ABC transporter permease [Propionicimonas sp.]